MTGELESAPPSFTRVAGYILAGGGSTRFASDKALAEFDGVPMLERIRETLAAVVPAARIVAAPGKYASMGIPTVADRWPGEGPLGGIITALADASLGDPQCACCLILGCDMPFLTVEWLAHLAGRCLAGDSEVVAPRSGAGLEPLCACWRPAAMRKLQAAFEQGVRKVTEAMKQLEMEVVDESEWKRFDSGHGLFWNMNTAADYHEAVRAWEARQR